MMVLELPNYMQVCMPLSIKRLENRSLNLGKMWNQNRLETCRMILSTESDWKSEITSYWSNQLIQSGLW